MDWTTLSEKRPGGLALTEELLAMYALPKGASIVDVGCGGGQTILLLHQKGYVATGIDNSSKLVESARRTAENAGFAETLSHRYIHGHGEQLPFETAGFDGALLECALSLMDRKKALAEIHRVLRPGGILYFSDIYTKEIADRQVSPAQPPTMAQWREAVAKADFAHLQLLDRSEALKAFYLNLIWRGEPMPDCYKTITSLGYFIAAACKTNRQS